MGWFSSTSHTPSQPIKYVAGRGASRRPFSSRTTSHVYAWREQSNLAKSAQPSVALFGKSNAVVHSIYKYLLLQSILLGS
jgi:hypothetical protein